MLLTLIRKEMMHHVLSVRFIALLMMCLLLIPLTFFINYRKHLQHRVDYQEAVKITNLEEKKVNPMMPLEPEVEVSKFFLEPTPLSVFANGLEDALPSYLGMTRNGVTQGAPALISAPLSYLLGHLDFLFVIGTVFSLLALLFTFDAVAGERETGTLRITLSNAVPRDLFLTSKLIGGYLVFVAPFLVAFLFGLMVLVSLGFPLGEADIFPRVLSLTLVSLLYIAVFFAIGVLISTYLDSAKTALIVAFTVWVFAVLIAPRLGFLTAQLIAPTRTAHSVYMEKAALRDNLNTELLQKKLQMIVTDHSHQTGRQPPSIEEARKTSEELDKRLGPLEEEYRERLQKHADQVDRRYQREKARQESLGETLSRVTPTSSLIYLVTNLTQTGKLKRSDYFQASERYYDRLDEELFGKIRDHLMVRHVRIIDDAVQIAQPPPLNVRTVADTLRLSAVDLLLLVLFGVVLTTLAFLKFFRMDI